MNNYRKTPIGLEVGIIGSSINTNNNSFNSFDRDNPINYREIENRVSGKKITKIIENAENIVDDFSIKNVRDPIKNVKIIEYPIIIDSVDRNITMYKNQYDMRIQFNPTTTTTEPYIATEKIQNVKYIKLENLIIPYKFRLSKKETANTTTLYNTLLNKITMATTYAQIATFLNSTENDGSGNLINYINITYSGPSGALTTWTIEVYNNENYSKTFFFDYKNGTPEYWEYYYNDNLTLGKERSLRVDIKEIATDLNEYSTNNLTSRSFCLVVPKDHNTSSDFMKFISGDIIKIFKEHNLIKIINLTIKIYDSNENILLNPHINYSIDVASTKFTELTLNTNGTDNIVWRSSKYYIRHPYYTAGQITLLFKVGIYDTEFNQIHFNDKLGKIEK